MSLAAILVYVQLEVIHVKRGKNRFKHAVDDCQGSIPIVKRAFVLLNCNVCAKYKLVRPSVMSSVNISATLIVKHMHCVWCNW